MTARPPELVIGFLLEKHGPRSPAPRISPVTERILRGLQERGVRVDCIVPENSVWDLSDLEASDDLYVLKSETPLALSLAGALTVAGGEVLNAYRAVNLVRDKMAATAVLAASGIPVPASYATGSAALLQPLLETGPLWLKPNRGTKGTGIQRLSLPGELDPSLRCQDPYGLPLPFFAQREFPSSGRDLKVYVVGDEVWATERPFPAPSDAEKAGRAVKVDQKIRAAALACGKALHLEIYGVDFLVSQDRFAVIDVNTFPGYKGVEEAPAALVDYIHRRALSARKRKGEKP